LPDRHSSPPGEASHKRKLAAILSADVVGYSRLMGLDEAGTHARLMASRGMIDRRITARGGRIVGTAGDSVLADFPSVVAALDAAVDIQRALHEENEPIAPEQRLEFRIGINLGDVIVEGDDIFGDGVNVAARLEGLSDPGGICVSGKVYEEVKHKLNPSFRDRGTHQVKNIAEPIHVYSVEPEGAGLRVKAAGRSGWPRHAIVAVGVGALLAGAIGLSLLVPGWRQIFATSPFGLFEGKVGSGLAKSAPSDGLLAKPTIAVLPFENQSGEAERNHFNEGVTQDIIGALGRFANLQLMSWDAVSQYQATTPSLEQVTTDLGVRYVVSGSIRRDASRVRVAVRLTDGVRGLLLWSERYDQPIDDIFTLQEKITQGVVGALAVRLTALEQERALAKPTDNLDAYEFVLRGRQHFQREARSENLKARELFEKAIELAPDYAEAWVRLGWTYNHDTAYGWTERPDRALQQAFDLAQEAIRLDPSNASAHTLLSNVYVYRQRHDLGLAEIDRAIALNPSDAEAHGWRGWIMLSLGRTAEAIHSSEMALRFNPNSPPSVSGNLGWAYFLEGRNDDAIELLESSLGQHPDATFGHAALAAAYAESDRPVDAARAAANVRRLHPFFEVNPFGELFRDPHDRKRIAAALRNAGLE